MNSKRIRSSQKSGRRKTILGFALVLASVAGVWLTIDLNNQTQDVLVAADAISGGSQIDDQSFRTTKMNLADSKGLYLTPGDVSPGEYLLYSAEPGQLVPKSWVASALIDSREPVVITSNMPLPTKVRVGDLVDIWVSKRQSDNRYSAPAQVVLNAEIAEIIESSGMLSDQAQRVQVLVPIDAVGTILDAIASKDALSLVLQRNLGNE